MSQSQPFCPRYGGGQTVVAAAASANVTIGAGCKQIVVTNLGANVGYVRIGKLAGLTAAATDACIPSGAVITLTKDQDDSVLAYISPLGCTLHVIPGEGW